MIVLRDPADTALIDHLLIRELAVLRYTQVLNGEPYDPAIHGDMVVAEPGDTVEQLEAAVGFPILHDLFTDAPFGHEDFAPCFEILEEHRNEQRNAEQSAAYEMVFIRNDDGFATTVFVPACEGTDPRLLAMCRSFATVTCD